MDRRDILKASAIFLGYGLVGGASVAVLNGCKADTKPDWTPSFFTPEQIDIIAEAAERILPKTDTPGAKDALVHRYIDEAVMNNFKKEEQDQILEGVGVFDLLSQEKFQKNFVDLKDEQKDAVLQHLADASKKEGDDNLKNLFPGLKSLVVTGYFTSEMGAKEALVYLPVPGPYEGCIPMSDVNGVYSRSRYG
ncbi:MAG: gluconate 2-dehydrogenase subunit 3 family protein [Bacteroidota bacterium]